MTNQQVFSSGKIIEEYNYIHPVDFEEEYIGYLVELDNIVYEIISKPNGNILHPSEESRIVSKNLDEIYDYCDYLHDRPLNICEPIIDEQKLKDKVYPYDEVDIVDGDYIIFNGKEIQILGEIDTEDYLDFFEEDSE